MLQHSTAIIMLLLLLLVFKKGRWNKKKIGTRETQLWGLLLCKGVWLPCSSYLESDHDGRGEVELAGRGNDALSDHVAPHDSAENVDKNSVHLKYMFSVYI